MSQARHKIPRRTYLCHRDYHNCFDSSLSAAFHLNLCRRDDPKCTVYFELIGSGSRTSSFLDAERQPYSLTKVFLCPGVLNNTYKGEFASRGVL
jgi:azurin